jgi:hypothetical protein
MKLLTRIFLTLENAFFALIYFLLDVAEVCRFLLSARFVALMHSHVESQRTSYWSRLRSWVTNYLDLPDPLLVKSLIYRTERLCRLTSSGKFGPVSIQLIGIQTELVKDALRNLTHAREVPRKRVVRKVEIVQYGESRVNTPVPCQCITETRPERLLVAHPGSC